MPPPYQPLKIITIGHHAYQPSCPYSLLTYALLLRLLSHFGFRVTNVHLSVCLSIIHQNPSTSQNYAYHPNVSHHSPPLSAYQPPCLSANLPINHQDNHDNLAIMQPHLQPVSYHSYQPSFLSAIIPHHMPRFWSLVFFEVWCLEVWGVIKIIVIVGPFLLDQYL